MHTETEMLIGWADDDNIFSKVNYIKTKTETNFQSPVAMRP